MNNLFLQFVPLLLTSLSAHFSVAQTSSFFSTTHPIEPIEQHYKRLSSLNPAAQKNHPLDTIAFQKEKYNSYALMFTIAEPAYLTRSQIHQMVGALSFPANSSEQTRAELDFLLELNEKRKPETIDRVKYLAKIGYWPAKSLLESHPEYASNLNQLLFECQEVVGVDCTIENYPMTTELLKGITLDMRIMEFTAKYHLLRARPYQLEERLQPLQIMGSPSFASGHTLWAYIHAYTFAELMPERRADFLELAYEIGLSREIMGIHYPSDEEAARQLAHQMLALMWQTEKFQQDFSAAQAEWK
ncbi:MAG: phosphatase PAP2 family protein [Bacteroidota bacterium]